MMVEKIFEGTLTPKFCIGRTDRFIFLGGHVLPIWRF